MIGLKDIYTITPINDTILEDNDYNGMYTMPYQCKLACDYAIAAKHDYLINSDMEDCQRKDISNILEASSVCATYQAIASFIINNMRNIVIFYCLKYVEEVVEKSEIDIPAALNLRNEMYQIIVKHATEITDGAVTILERNTQYIESGPLYPVTLSLLLNQIVSLISIYVMEPLILALYNKIYTDHRICTTLYKNYIDENTETLENGVTSSGWQAITGILREIMEPYFFQMSSAITLLSEPAYNMFVGDNQGENKKYSYGNSMEEYVKKDPIIIDILDLYDDDENE